MTRDEAIKLIDILNRSGFQFDLPVEVLEESFSTFPEGMTIREIFKHMGIDKMVIFDEKGTKEISLSAFESFNNAMKCQNIDTNDLTMSDVANCIEEKQKSA